jgi:hypothetical protein
VALGYAANLSEQQHAVAEVAKVLMDDPDFLLPDRIGSVEPAVRVKVAAIESVNRLPRKLD